MDGDCCDQVAAWKAALEDPEALKDYSAASIWAAVRRDFGGVLRTPYGVLAASHEHALLVLSDPARHYSVEGYRERAAPTLGDMYLGLDDLGPGCPYRARSAVPNQAIRTLVDEKTAFDAARALTRASIDQLIATEIENAQSAGDTVWRLQFGANEVWDDVLAGLCRQWFGLPDSGRFVEAGRFRWDWQPGMPVPYPGHFLSPSRYIFQPEPGSEVVRIGSLHGTAVNSAFRAWVADLRDHGQLPTAPDGTPAPLGQAFFEAVPRSVGGSPQDNALQDERLAVILLGALIGFLPTVQGNLRQSLNEWLLDGTFWSLRAGLQKADKVDSDAVATIRAALQRSMMLRPSPEVVWRRATCDHALGPVSVRRGETVVAAIVSATHEQLEQGATDEGMVFGGWSATPPPQGTKVPTHACPGHCAAMGTLCGILVALLETTEALRPTAFSLGFRLEGAMPPPEVVSPAPAIRQLRPGATETGKKAIGLGVPPPAALATAAAGPLKLLAGGDSWYSFGQVPFQHSDIIKQLGARGIQVTNLAIIGTTLQRFAGKPQNPGGQDNSLVAALCTRFKQLSAQGNSPDAVLVSAGGNDVVSSAIKSYIKDISGQGLSAAQIKALIAVNGEIDQVALANLMDGPGGAMRAQVQTVLDKLRKNCVRADGSPVPVVWQAYDYPVPDGRNWGLLGPSAPHNKASVLWKPLSDLGYTDLADGAAIMKKVVNRYNEMLKGMQAKNPGQLIHADLRGTLNSTLPGNAYQADWDNEMHATAAGFKKLADIMFANYLRALVPN
jgi:hypothetical protein